MESRTPRSPGVGKGFRIYRNLTSFSRVMPSTDNDWYRYWLVMRRCPRGGPQCRASDGRPRRGRDMQDASAQWARESYRTTCLQSLEDELMAQTNLGSTSPCLLMSRLLSYSGPSTPCGPSWFQSYAFFFLGSWANILLVFVPVTIFLLYATCC
jgi:hypothetical protein